MKLKTLLVSAVALLCSAGAWATDYTSKMSSAQGDWSAATGTYGGVAPERYNGDTNQFPIGEVLTQTISDLPNGYYLVCFYAWENYSNWKETSISYGDNIAQAFANDATQGFEVIKNKGGRDWNAANTYTLLAEVTDGTLKYGVKNIAAGGNWAVCRPISLTHVEGDLTSVIKNPSFESGDKTGWTDETASDGSGEGRDDKIDIISTDALPGKDGAWFAERWWWNSNINIHQTTPTLPEGFYRITAYAKADDGDIVIYGKAGDNSEVTTAVGTVGDYSVEIYQSSSNGIKLGLKGHHLSQTHVAFDNFRLTYLGNPKADLTTLQGTIDASYLNNATYANVGGSERTDLTEAKTLTAASETAAAYEAAISTVQAVIEAFVAAADNYDALAAINAKIEAIGTLPYALSAKKPSAHEGTSSSDAASFATSLITALRTYVESNGLGEGVDATNYTDRMTNNICPGPKTADDKAYSTADGWNLSYVRFDGGEGWMGSSTSHDVYYGSNGYFWGNFSGSRNSSMQQVISDLPVGKYLLTVRARSSGTVPTLYISGNGMQQDITNPNGVFGNGWDDTSVLFTVGANKEAIIRLQAQKESDGTMYRWYNADNFRLVRIDDLDGVTIAETETSAPATTTDYKNVTLTRTLNNSYWNTFCSPIDIDATNIVSTFGDGTLITEFDTDASIDNNTLTFKSADAIEAGKPYLIKPANTTANPTFSGVKVTATSGQTITNGSFKFIGVIAQTELAPNGDGGSINYFVNTSNKVVKLSEAGNLKGMRAYFNAPASASPVKMYIDGIETSIGQIDNEQSTMDKASIYNLAGQRLSKAQKGVNIINGKKVLVK